MGQQYLRSAILRLENSTFQVLILENLRVSFEIVKDESSTVNKAKIQVFNLNQNSRTFLEDEELKVQLEVGYETTIGESSNEILFIGNLGKKGKGRTWSERMGQEWVTNIECGDGEKQVAETNAQVSFDKGVPFTAIISQVAQSFGLPIGNVQPVGEGIALNGFSADGKAAKILDKLAKRFNFNWSIQNNAVQITREGIPTPEVGVVLTPQTGLVGNVTKREEGIQCKALLNPQISPGRLLTIAGSAQVTAGVYKVTKATYRGDTFGAAWNTEIEAIAL